MTVLLDDVLRYVEVWLSSISQKPIQFLESDLDPVLLVPGIAGSILNAVDERDGEERVWVRIFGADAKFRTKLWSRFDSSTGETVCLDPGTRISVPEDRHGLYAIDVLDPCMMIGRECVYYFHEMIAEMISWGFQEGRTLFGFGYDFRQSNRFQDTLCKFSQKLEHIYNISGGKKINIISHSMGGLLVKCFMGLHSDVFEKYVKKWVAIAAPFQGAPGYVTSTLLNGMSFVEGWEQNFFISKWNMHQLLIECPSVYELMASNDFEWEHNPILQIWRKKADNGLDAELESYPAQEAVPVFLKALSNNKEVYDGKVIPLPFNMEILKWANETKKLMSGTKVPPGVDFFNIYGVGLDTPHSSCYGFKEDPISDLQELLSLKADYICIDGDGTVPTESAKADGLQAAARVGIPGEHRGLICDRHVFRVLKQWLKVGEPDTFYNPLNDYVILPTSFEIGLVKGRGRMVISHEVEDEDGWDIVSTDGDGLSKEAGADILISSSDQTIPHVWFEKHESACSCLR